MSATPDPVRSDDVILSTAASWLVPLLAAASVVVLLRGHNEPGGGFVGGLLASAACTLLLLTRGAEALRLPLDPRTLIGVGLLVALVSHLLPLAYGNAFAEAMWFGRLPLIGKVGTVLFFDVGVYLVVWGATLLAVLELYRAQAAEDAR